MAPARRGRSPQETSQPLYADDSDEGIEKVTPRQHRQHLKKRLSEAYVVDNDGSFVSDSGRPPLVAVNLNDDAAEKRRRRKSTKITVVEDLPAGTSEEGPNPDQDIAESSRTTKQKQQLNSIAPPPVMNVPLDVMSSNFEEWMKMATDNVRNLTLSSIQPFSLPTTEN